MCKDSLSQTQQVNEFLKDYSRCLVADGIREPFRLQSFQRYARRTMSRCWRDQETIRRPRIFCQNSGACGSSYIVQLLRDNGVERCFHELEPDLNQLALDHFEASLPESRLVRILRYTRHDVFFEANNRLFSFSKELRQAFPNARFVHLHRHPADAVRSAMSKPNVANYLDQNIRFRGTLAGQRNDRPLKRFCLYWNTINRRIADDLADVESLSLKFANLVAGNIESLEVFLDRSLPIRKIRTVNKGAIRKEGRFPDFADWDRADQQTLYDICGATMELLGYPR